MNIDNYCSVKQRGVMYKRVHCSPDALCTCSSMATRGSLEPLLHAYVQRGEPKEKMIRVCQSSFSQISVTV